MKLSKHFTLEEAVFSEKAIRHGIDNTPNDTQLANIKALFVNCMDKVRDLFGVPIKPSSVFRTAKVNKLASGAKNSQHLMGEACDFRIPSVSVKNTMRAIYDSGIEFDQMINEYDAWVHISYRQGKNRREMLYTYKQKGETVTVPITRRDLG